MDRFIKNIDNQIKFNQSKNIFLDNLDFFQFAEETVKAISNIDKLNPDSKEYLIDYATDKAIEEFCRVNQYYSFDLKAKNNLRKIYSDLFENFRIRTNSIEDISKIHYEKLKSWLKENNPFAEKIYKKDNEIVSAVACSEYSPELQFNILQIDVKQLMQPILDIGCGTNGHLVNYFIDQGLEVYGIDRFKFTTSNLKTADWLEYDYGKDKWGTIISNIGFSNHFYHHNLREDGNYIGYGKTYVSILNSLKVGGCFHYAPDLPFIEKYLDKNQFDLKKYEIDKYDFKTTIIRKMK
ncbi:class I SAM-dependent methyltransferase [uncultured Draconibacterium sp.]|uniref:class I SAM-dependent methyltransferase n=1 Tax=uncultured Draconibacterium sp. TaxID=1573823 RepID=UPI0029C8DA80|nr:class I SAM-dependent methyltransferase [uncultured Draconibacterium sp.]